MIKPLFYYSRWLFLLPVAILSCYLAHQIVSLFWYLSVAFYINPDSLPAQINYFAVTNAAIGFSFVYFAYIIAPSQKKRIAFIFFGIAFVIAVTVLSFALSEKDYWAVYRSIMVIIGAILGLCLIYQSKIFGLDNSKAIRRSKERSIQSVPENMRYHHVTENANAETHYNLGIRLKKLNNYNEAIESFKRAIQIDPEYYFEEAYYEIGKIYFEIENYEEAINSLRLILPNGKPEINVQNDGYGDALFYIGNSYHNLGFYEEAMNAYKQAIGQKPYNWVLHYCLGESYAELEKFNEATNAFKKAIRHCSDKKKHEKANLYFSLGESYAELEKFNEAINAYKKALKLNPNEEKFYHKLGTAFLLNEKYKDAVNAFENAFLINKNLKNSAEIQYFLGICYGMIEKYEDALQALKKTIQINPGFKNKSDVYYHIGVCCGMVGRQQEEIEAYKKAIEIDPKKVKAHYNLGIIYAHNGDLSSAYKIYNILRELDKHFANLLLSNITK